jgi:DNA-binding NarL/FixJ family response regulator
MTILVDFRCTEVRMEKKTRVLIVDDMPQVIYDLRTLLPLAGKIQIAGEAHDGREALQLMETLPVDVVLMDLEMPGMDGWEAARRIKASWPSCRVIALTVHSAEEARQIADMQYFDDFIVKGVPAGELIQIIEK